MGRLKEEETLKLIKLLKKEFKPYKVSNNFMCYKTEGKLHLSSFMYVVSRNGIALSPFDVYKIVRENAENNTRDNNIHKINK